MRQEVRVCLERAEDFLPRVWNYGEGWSKFIEPLEGIASQDLGDVCVCIYMYIHTQRD